MNTLNFDKNYNKKLNSYYFTTIRSWYTCYEKNIVPDSTIEVTLDRDIVGRARVISVTPLDLRVPFEELSNVELTALSIDTGKHPKDAYELIKQDIGIQVALILLGW